MVCIICSIDGVVMIPDSTFYERLARNGKRIFGAVVWFVNATCALDILRNQAQFPLSYNGLRFELVELVELVEVRIASTLVRVSISVLLAR